MSDELEALRQDHARLRQALEHARLELEDFTYSVSHDLRASLRHVTAYLQIIDEDAGELLDRTNHAHLQTAGEAARQMGRLMDGLMELSRLGRVALHPSAVSLSTLVAEAQQVLAPELAQRAVLWRVAPDLPGVSGDAALLRQMLVQLLANALKFSDHQNPAAIEIGWEAGSAGQCVLWVRDEGVGFQPEQAARLFRAFTRLHPAAEFPGIGMGLALARKIVERHGGSISASAQTGAGCCVRLSLPLAP
ncbi:sensor histidine kinase [Rhodoferax sp.]|uniref:sensor histidine kinase n=1 Tax=Rhodoferax sp. TaxID=50421 RepID=UPI00276B08AD|nr:ATP-binding protein [Rhodoferax sp.]